MINSYLTRNFNNSTLSYNLEKYPFPELVLEVMKEKFPSITQLDQIHQVVKAEDLVILTNLVQKAFGSREFGQLFDSFAEEYIKPLIGEAEYLIKRFPTLNLVVPDQAKLGRLLNFHKGTYYANGLGQGTIWMPLTKTFESNSMWVLEYEDSERISQSYIEDQWSQAKFEAECMKVAHAVTLEPGQAHLFHQAHLHGNINNKTGVTRLAIDWHILLKGEPFHQRLPGGFFRLAGDYAQHSPTLHHCVIYTSCNSWLDRTIPSYLQTSFIEQWCRDSKITYSMRIGENESATHLPILEDLIQQRHNIVIFSIHSLPEDEDRRNYLLNLALNNGVKLYFMNEYLELNKTTLPKIKEYLSWRTQ